MPDRRVTAPDSIAVRVALWRALHIEVDVPPHVLQDVVGLALVAQAIHGASDRTWTRSA